MKATRKKLSCRFSPQSMKPSPRRMTPYAGFLPRNSLYFTITRRNRFSVAMRTSGIEKPCFPYSLCAKKTNDTP